jgi:hypothetical protein
MHPTLLFVHSWLRWLALAAVLLVFFRGIRGAATGAPWRAADMTWMKGAAHLLTVQLMVGVLLFAVSPTVRALLSDMGAAMQDRTSRLIIVEHPVIMVLALGATHMGASLTRRAPTDQAKHVRAAVSFGIALLLIGYAIPWARPFFRLGM